MRLHRLSITGVGPFLRTQDIDFDDLSTAGLFLIDGPTGSGKTTIIDAIVYALFGDVSGGGDSDAGRIRSSYCTEADPSGVTLEFSVDGRRHLISRVPAGARDPEMPERAAAKKPARQVLTEYTATGDEKVVLTKVGEIREHVESLLTMTADQFRHLVVLPQGKFADLLRMTPTDRLTELASLLDQREFFARVQDELKREGARADETRRAARDAVSSAAQQVSGRLAAYLPEGDSAFTDAAASDDDRLGAVEAVLADLSSRAEAATGIRDARRSDADHADAAAVVARAIATAIADVGEAQHRADQARAALHAEDAGLAAADVPPRVADLRTRAGSLADMAAWEAESDVRAAQRDQLRETETQARADAEQLTLQRQSLPQERIRLEGELAAAQLLATSRAGAEQECTRLRGLVAVATEHAAAQREQETLIAKVATAEQEAATASTHADEAEQEWLALIADQRAQQAAALAAVLTDGQACPVCGSATHPEPAHPPEGIALVTDAQVAERRAIVDQARVTAAAAEAAARDRRADRDAGATRVAGLAGALGSTSIDELTTAAQAAEVAHAESIAAEDSLPQLRAAIDAVATQDAALAEQIVDARERAAQAAGQRAALETAEADERARIAALVGDAGSATALLATVRDRVTRLEDCAAADAHLANAAAAVPPDQRGTPLEQARQAAADAETAQQSAATALAEAEAALATLVTAVAEARPLVASFAGALHRRREIDADTAVAAELAQLATGHNRRSLPLRSYALQRRFESVLAAATVHLHQMSSGKFSFELNEETTRGQAGLGIALHDAWTGHKQDPKSLSGGETFYAALSLALGLADVVRGEAGGSALETLFIDEGFGSLDQDSLYHVLDQLDHLRAGHRVIGVISHVTEMKESISDRIEVRRGADSTSSVTRAG